jgi:HNH endonuclease family protein|nr:MAG TPA: homing endonuclease [Caudoviricetes sp.]
MKNTKETWKPVVGYEGLYEVSSKGKVRGLKTGRILKPFYTKGYAMVNLTSTSNDRTKKLVHRLVAQAFIPNLKNLSDVNHKDEIKTNNNLDNLEWISHKDNLNYGTRNERAAKRNIAEGHRGLKLSEQHKASLQKAHKADMKHVRQLTVNGVLIAEYDSIKAAERTTGINRGGISACINGKQQCTTGRDGVSYMWKLAG